MKGHEECVKVAIHLFERIGIAHRGKDKRQSRSSLYGFGGLEHIDAACHEHARQSLALGGIDGREQRMGYDIAHIVVKVAPLAAHLGGAQVHRHEQTYERGK